MSGFIDAVEDFVDGGDSTVYEDTTTTTYEQSDYVEETPYGEEVVDQTTEVQTTDVQYEESSW
ncbi:hypothetical protein WOLCODRAFT_136861 [Wolfiporia cocos MD-104 SS10]|uniref:Uncharacterized protein n=1 Tax=Wolfiporia cocos (strain MD-104) TaxID=742152 RepID=A0A2H3JNM9_WOLCO|nr:hypothetical protein WOLCODRAFT_136861 [Wolfiporia cocos MD-104 SS10]